MGEDFNMPSGGTLFDTLVCWAEGKSGGTLWASLQGQREHLDDLIYPERPGRV